MEIIGLPDGATPLDPEEMNGLKHKHVTTRGELDELEQANITNGMRWLNKQKNPNILTAEFVRELHKRLFGDVWSWAGTFRTTEKNIGIAPYLISQQLHLLLDDTVFWIQNSTYPPLELAARFHHRLVYIHPFPNGNGRHSRIIADAILVHIIKEQPIDWAGGMSLDKISERRTQYISALRAADGFDWGPLMDFVS
ncbi:mobile mystery protein B [Methylophaga sp.]|uniref:mobile mystery protein B n=1 Tax=Methylophaga sp. TaxID=2024840 RepID=UPI00271B44E7|nr:mobile mystery protein B [Methylophaga sp.]MDO8826801.1 mobile mystery protein B [Methylophaga sp.]